MTFGARHFVSHLGFSGRCSRLLPLIEANQPTAKSDRKVEDEADIDGDTAPNFLDSDSDSDGICDRDEWTFGSDPYE